MRSDSREYLEVRVTSTDVELDTQPVYIAAQLTTSSDAPTWNPATWVGDAGFARTARILVGPGGSPSVGELTPGTYRVLVKVTDNPEIPTAHAYALRVTLT